jgi:hypothetical protein
MKQRPILAIALAFITMAAVGCGAARPSATATPAPVSYLESMTSFCSAFTSLVKAVGNPDSGGGSELSKALDAAVAAHDVAAANRAADAITAELESGRRAAAVAKGWAGATTTMAAMDQVLAAYEAAITAERAAASPVPGAVDANTAFANAGGSAAWSALVAAAGAMKPEAGPTPPPCKAFSGT